MTFEEQQGAGDFLFGFYKGMCEENILVECIEVVNANQDKISALQQVRTSYV